MIFLVLSLAIQVALIIHVIRTGRNQLWILAIALLPGAGWLAYIIAEILPGMLGSRGARRASRQVRRLIDPDRDLREASAAVEFSGNVDARRRLGEQLYQRGDHAQAVEVYAGGLRGVFEHDPTLLAGLARAQFAAGDFSAARSTLERLAAHNPAAVSPETGLLYARALEDSGDTAAALAQYAVISPGFPGAEARLRHALLVRKTGDAAEASRMLRELLRAAELAPAHYRRAQAQWLERAAREVG